MPVFFTLVMSQGFVWTRTPGKRTPSRLAARWCTFAKYRFLHPCRSLCKHKSAWVQKSVFGSLYAQKKNHTQHVVLNSRATDGTRTRDLHLGKVAYYQLYYYRIHYLLFIRTINIIQYIYQLVKYIFNFICRTFLLVFAYYSVKIIFCLINRKLIESPQKVEQNFFIFSLTIPSLYGIVDIVLMNTI